MNLPLSLVVFAYNEEPNIPSVLPDILAWLRGHGEDYELIFVNDGSTDRTLPLARDVLANDPRTKIVSHDRNLGIGAALKTGVRSATLPWVSFLPCDGQIPASELDRLCCAVNCENVRVAFSVYRARDDGFLRKVLSLGVRGLILAIHGVVMRSDGPYLFRREIFDPDLLAPDSFFLNFEFPIRVFRSGERYSTVTIDCVPRLRGASKSAGLKRIVDVAKDLLGLRWRLWQGR